MAYGALLRVEKAKPARVALTSQTGRALRLRPRNFRLLTELSPDGVRLPDTPEAFQEELLCQAQEVHCGHAGIPLDLSGLRAPVRASDPIDDPDFISRMRAALPRPPEPPVAGALPTHHNMEQAVKKGCPTTSLDKLPQPLVSAQPGFGLRVLVGVREALASRTPADCSRRCSTSASPRSSRRGWCAIARPSCWRPTFGGRRRALCRIAGSSTGSNRWPWPAAGCWPAGPSSTGRSGQTTGMRRMLSVQSRPRGSWGMGSRGPRGVSVAMASALLRWA